MPYRIRVVVVVVVVVPVVNCTDAFGPTDALKLSQMDNHTQISESHSKNASTFFSAL
jgi:hypothetical protein